MIGQDFPKWKHASRVSRTEPSRPLRYRPRHPLVKLYGGKPWVSEGRSRYSAELPSEKEIRYHEVPASYPSGDVRPP